LGYDRLTLFFKLQPRSLPTVLSGTTKNYHLDLLTTTPLSISPILDPTLHFTRNTAASLHLPILDALQPPTRRARSASTVTRRTSGIPRPVQPLGPPHLVPKPASMKMAKIDLPALTGDLDAANVTSWLNLCEDSFEAWSALNSDRQKIIKLPLCYPHHLSCKVTNGMRIRNQIDFDIFLFQVAILSTRR
jgi:hypothetical protein